jgi:hypothetical protein
MLDSSFSLDANPFILVFVAILVDITRCSTSTGQLWNLVTIRPRRSLEFLPNSGN